MNLLFITDNFPPEVNAPASRTFEHCRIWARLGVAITVITCAPNFPQGKVYEGYRNRLWQTETIEGIRVIRVWSYISSNEGFLRRVLDYLSFAVAAFFAGLFIRTDLIVATSPQFFTTLAGYGLSVIKRRPWIFELRDLWPESIVAVGAMRKSRAIAFLERVEHFMYRKATRIVAVTQAFKSHLVSRDIDVAKIDVITNGVDLAALQPGPKDPSLLLSLGLKGKFIVGYIGTHGLAHGLDFIVDCLPHVSDPDLHFLFIGDGAEKAAIVERAKMAGISNATFLPSVSRAEVGRYLSLLDASLVPLRRSDTFKTVIPSKIFEAAALEKPILLGVDGQAREIVERHGAGLYFEPENREAFLNAVRSIKADPQLYSRLRTGCRHLAQAYDRTSLATDMLSVLRSTLPS